MRINDVIASVKEVGDCAAGQKTDRTLVLNIPVMHTPAESVPSTAPRDAILMAGLPGNMYGQIIRIKYMLSVYVKHVGHSGRGGGAVVSTPVTIARGLEPASWI